VDGAVPITGGNQHLEGVATIAVAKLHELGIEPVGDRLSSRLAIDPDQDGNAPAGVGFIHGPATDHSVRVGANPSGETEALATPAEQGQNPATKTRHTASGAEATLRGPFSKPG
jgi:hypothetical protein